MPKAQWKKGLESIHVGREATGVAWLETVSLKLPFDVIALIDSVSDNRSKFIRTAIMHELERVLPEEDETEDAVVDETEEPLTERDGMSGHRLLLKMKKRRPKKNFNKRQGGQL